MLIRVHGLRELRINSEFQPYRGSVRFPLPSAVRLLVFWFQCCHAWPKIVLGRVSFRASPPPRACLVSSGVRTTHGDNALPSLTSVPMSLVPGHPLSASSFPFLLQRHRHIPCRRSRRRCAALCRFRRWPNIRRIHRFSARRRCSRPCWYSARPDCAHHLVPSCRIRARCTRCRSARPRAKRCQHGVSSLSSAIENTLLLFLFIFFPNGCLRPLDPVILGLRLVRDCSFARLMLYYLKIPLFLPLSSGCSGPIHTQPRDTPKPSACAHIDVCWSRQSWRSEASTEMKRPCIN